MYKIITTPNSILSLVAKPVLSFDKKLERIISEMESTLIATTDPKGVGLAAPQVGLPLRLFLAKPTDDAPVVEFINPEIIQIDRELTKSKSGSRSKKLLEGCLSLPNIWGHVTRNKTLILNFQDVKGEKHKKKFSGFMAIIIQHEIDHLNGILFTKYVVEQGNKLYKSYKDEKGEDEFEEIKI